MKDTLERYQRQQNVSWFSFLAIGVEGYVDQKGVRGKKCAHLAQFM